MDLHWTVSEHTQQLKQLAQVQGTSSKKMGQVALKSFGLYSELVIMNEMCFVESWSLPVITYLTYNLVIHMRNVFC